MIQNLNMLSKVFAKTLQHLRTERGFSQEDFAELARLHRTYISQLERGLKSPSLQTIYRICHALDIKMSDLFLLLEKELDTFNDPVDR